MGWLLNRVKALVQEVHVRTVIAFLLLGVVGRASNASEVTGHTKSLRWEGGGAVILASLIDGLKLEANGAHPRELKCVIDGSQKACRASRPGPFTVVAARIACSESDVAVGEFECEVESPPKHGGAQRALLKGHAAFELQSALREAGVDPEGAAGHLVTLATAVRCTLDMTALLAKAGGGATCELVAGGE